MVDPVIPRIQDASSAPSISKVVAQVKEGQAVKDQPKQQKQVAESKKSDESNSDQSSRDSQPEDCLLYTSPSPRDGLLSRMPSSA